MKPSSGRMLCTFLCALALGLFGCAQLALAQAATPSATAAQSEKTSGTVSTEPTGADGETTAKPHASASALVIGPQDEVDVKVYGAPDLSGRRRVASDGDISLPLIGFVHIAGLTSDRAQQAIGEQLRAKNIVKNPQVSVFVKEYTNGEISV